jgi:hypothetical protein
MSEDAQKPPAQAIGVEGFVALATKPAEPALDWRVLAQYPPFQMYVEEREYNAQGINSAQYALERGQAAFAEHGEDFIKGYLAWWEGKGYWRGEDPMGRR